MKKELRLILLFGILFIIPQFGHSQCLSTPPAYEDFDSYATCSSSCGATCIISNSDWHNTSDDDGDWAIDNNGTSSSSTGPDGDATGPGGSGNYVYTEASSPCYGGDTYHLESECFSVPSNGNYFLKFLYHMYGQSMGTLHIDYRTDPALPYTPDLIPPITDNLKMWQEKLVSLSAFSGENQLQLRFRGVTGSNFYSDMALDGIEFIDLQDNVAAVEITQPSTQCGLTNSESVTVVAENLSGGTIPSGTNIDWELKVNGATVANETQTLSSAWADGTQINYTFTQTVDLSTFGPYNLEAIITYAPDNYLRDDVASKLVENKTMNAFPIIEDFEGLSECSLSNCTDFCDFNASWTNSRADSSDWITERGPGGSSNTGPNVDHTTGSSSGVYVYVDYNTTVCAGAVADLESNCIDFTNAAKPVLSFWYHMYGTYMGTLQVEISTDGGNTYTILVPPFTDNQDKWQNLEVDLSAYAGESQVKIRLRGMIGPSSLSEMALDDIMLIDKGGEDLAVTEIINPGSACGLTKENVEIEIENQGTQAVPNGTNIPVSYFFAGNPVVNETLTLSSDLQPGQTVNYLFTTQANINPGTSVIQADVKHANDNNDLNDTLSKTIRNESPTTGPSTMTFDGYSTCSNSCFSSCFFSGMFENVNYDDFDWVVETGATPSSNTGPSQDHTTGTGNYIYTEINSSTCYNSVAILEARCQDFSSMSNPSLNFWYHMYGSGIGTLHIDVKEGNDPWTQDVALVLSGNLDQWLNQSVDLSAYAGEPSVSIRFRAVSGSSTIGDIALDDISILDASQLDLTVTEIVSPNSGCNLGNSETVSIQFQNNSNQIVPAGTDITMGFSVRGIPTTEVFTTPNPIPPSTPQSYTFNAGADLTFPGDQDFKAFLTIAGDNNPVNDTLRKEVANQTFRTTSALETFDSETAAGTSCTTVQPLEGFFTNIATDDSDWLVRSGSTSSTSTGPSSDHTGGGNYVYTEGSSCLNSTAILESKCVDLSGLTSPILSFWLHMYGSSMGTLSIDIDDGTGFQNDVFGPFTDDNNSWQEIDVSLGQWAGQQITIRFRGETGSNYFTDMALDDITLKDAGGDNVFIEQVVSPQSGCNNSNAMPVEVLVKNTSVNPIPAGDTLFMSYQFKSKQVVDTVVLSSAIPANSSYNYTFSETINAAGFGQYSLDITVFYRQDSYHADDTKTHTFTGESLGLPHLEDFGKQSNNSNSCTSSNPPDFEGAWKNVEGTDDMNWTTHSLDVSPSTTGPSSDHTGNGGSYLYTRVSTITCALYQADIISPCINLTNAQNPKLDFWYFLWGQGMGQIQIAATLNGGNEQILVPSITDTTQAWKNYVLDLDQFIGEPELRLIIRSIGGATVQSDVAVDDILVADFGFEDLEITDLSSPDLTGCGLGSNESVTVEITHNGTQTIPSGTNIPMTLIFDGTTYNESLSLSADLDPGNSINYTYSQTVDVSNFGSYPIEVSVNHTNDVYPANDTVKEIIQSLTVSQFPVVTDFENESTCGTSCTSPCVLNDVLWRNIDGDDKDWVTDKGGTSSTSTGPSNDHTLGTSSGTYIYLEGSSCYEKTAILESACFNLTNGQSPELEFWYHMYGSSMGQLHLDIKVDGGPWQNDFTDSISDHKNQWQQKIISLKPYVGSTVNLRFRGVTGTNFYTDMALDDITIRDRGSNDLVAISMEGVSGGCVNDPNTQVSIKMLYYGDPIPVGTNLDMEQEVNGTVYPETFTTSQAYNHGDTIEYTFTRTIDLSSPSITEIKLRGYHPAEISLLDNEVTEISQFIQASFGTLYDFENESTCSTNCGNACELTGAWYNETENDDIDWTADIGGTPSIGTGPSQDHTTGSSTGVYLYTEASSCNIKEAHLISPCFDLSNFVQPGLEVWYHMYGDQMGSLHLDAYQDGQWFTDIGASVTDNENKWKQATFPISQIDKNKPVVLRLRAITGSGYESDIAIDDISFTEVAGSDLSVSQLVRPFSGCLATAESDVEMELTNKGSVTFPQGDTLDISYEFEGNRFEESIILTQNFFPGNTLNITFSAPIYVDQTGIYDIELTATHRLDEVSGNDTLTASFKNESVRAFPFTEDFEQESNCSASCGTVCTTQGAFSNVYNDQRDWIAYSGATPTSGTGPSSDHTLGNASGHYMYFEGDGCTNDNAFLMGPCLDFTDADDIFIEFYYHMQGSSMGTMHLDVKIGGGFWFFDYVPSWTDNNNAWVKKRINLPGLKNRSNVRLRFRATGGSGNLTDMAIDDITIMACKKPKITTVNGLYTACRGDSLLLKVRPDNFTNITWYKDGQVLNGVTGSELYVSEADTGYYYVQTDFPFNCSKVSDSIHFTMVDIPNKPDVLYDGPGAICPGDFLNLSSSEQASFYQWYRNGKKLSGKTQSNINVSDPGHYYVEVWNNPSCKELSDSAFIDRAPSPDKPNIASPDGLTGCHGDSLRLVADPGFSRYQWLYNGNPILGANNPTHYAKSSGNYRVQVFSNFECDTVSDIVQVQFTFVNGFDISPQGPLSFCEGDKVIFEANQNASIQWYRNHQAITGATTLAFAARDSGTYYAVAHLSGCVDTSSKYLVQVDPRPGKPMVSPKDTVVCDANPVQLIASNTSGSIQWFKDGQVLSGQNGNQLSVSQTGEYVIRITDANGCSNSDTSFFANFDSDQVTASVTDSVICSGKKVKITSSIPFGNQWYFNGSVIPGETDQSIWTENPGDYFTIVKRDSCIDTSNTVSLTQTFGQSKPVITNHGDSVICDGGSTLLQSTNAVSYQWVLDGNHIQGANAEFYTATLPGEYLMIAQNQFGCADTSDPVYIFQHPSIDLFISGITDNSCEGNQDGSVQLGVTGGSPDYNYTLDGFTWTSQPEFFGLASGSYRAYVVDGNGCYDSVDFNIDHGGSDLFMIYTVDPVLCFDDSTNIYFSGTGGQAPYEYAINDGPFFSQDQSRIKAGTYQLKVKDFNGCVVALDSIDIDQPSELIGNAFLDQEILCADDGNGIISATGSGGTPPYRYSIDNGTTFQTSNTFGQLGPGEYQITLQDDYGCETVLPSIKLEEPEPLALINVDFIRQDVSCYGGSDAQALLTVDGGTPPYSFSTDGVNFNGAAFIGNLSPDSVQFTVRDANACEVQSEWFTIFEPDSISGTAQATKHVDCYGYATGRLEVNAQGGTGNLEYAIDLVNYQSSPIFDSLLARTYDNITVRDENGCVVFLDPVTINEPAPFTADALVDPITCQGQNDAKIQINALGGIKPYTFSIDGGQSFASDSIFDNLGPGTYPLVVQDAAGCEALIGDPLVVIDDPAAFLLDTVLVNHVGCFGQSNGVLTVNLLGGVQPYQYSLDGGQSWTNNPVLNGLPADTFNLLVRDANGCNLLGGQYIITQPVAISASAVVSQPISCNGANDGTITLSATGGNGGFSYSIDGGQTFTGNPVFSGLSAATYSILVKDFTDCQVVVSVQVGQPLPIQTGNLSVQQISCFGANDGRISLTATGGTGQRSFSIDGGTSYQTNGVFNNLSPGTYPIVVKDANDCQTNVQVIQMLEPDSLVGQNVLVQAISCGGTATGSFMAQVQGGTPPYAYSLNGAPAVSDSVFDNLAAGAYGVTVTDVNGCVLLTDSITLTQPPVLTGTGMVTQHVSCHDASDGVVTLNAQGGGGNYTFSSDGNTYGPSNVFTGLPTGTYTFYVMDANGCITPIGPIEVLDQNPLLLSLAQTAEVSCYGYTDAQITANAQGGNGIRQFNLNGGAWTLVSVFQNLGAGTYVVGVQDAIGCERYDTLVVDQPDSLFPSLDLKFVPNPGDNNGYIRIDLVGGTQPYNYLWSNGATTQDIFGLSRGVYTVQIQDANGCSTEYTVDLTQYGVGLEDSEAYEIALFPNPATTEFKVLIEGYSGTMNLEIYNSIGELMLKELDQPIQSDGHSVDASNWAPGLYTVRLQTDAFTEVKQVVIGD